MLRSGLIFFGMLIGMAGLLTIPSTRPLAPLQPTDTLHLNGQELAIQKVTTPDELSRGLNGYAQPNDSQGMLFDFGHYTEPTFWMHGMRYPIDLIWLGEEGVLGWETHLRPDGGLRRYRPGEPVRYVLEVRSGWVDDFDIQREMPFFLE